MLAWILVAYPGLGHKINQSSMYKHSSCQLTRVNQLTQVKLKFKQILSHCISRGVTSPSPLLPCRAVVLVAAVFPRHSSLVSGSMAKRSGLVLPPIISSHESSPSLHTAGRSNPLPSLYICTWRDNPAVAWLAICFICSQLCLAAFSNSTSSLSYLLPLSHPVGSFAMAVTGSDSASLAYYLCLHGGPMHHTAWSTWCFRVLELNQGFLSYSTISTNK